MLDERLVCRNVKARDKEEVIRILSNLLVQYGYVKDSYAQAVIDREKVFATGLEMPGGDYNIAIPHTDVIHVLKPALAIAVLDEPVTFIHMATEDQPVSVHLVFALAIADPAQVVDFLKQIITALQEPDLRKKLKEAATEAEVVELLRQRLQ